MIWQIGYALKNIEENWPNSTAEHEGGEFIKISTDQKPDVLAAILASREIGEEDAKAYHSARPELDFLCGYRSECVWNGSAIKYAELHGFGWGSFGTLGSAVVDENARSAQHKTFAFSDRLIRQFGKVERLERQYDRVYEIALWGGNKFRMAMLAEYEPTADGVRSAWDAFGPVDVIWNINPNGNPTGSAIEAGKELGCEVLKWEGFKEYMKKL